MDCEDSGFLYQYSVSATELQVRPAAMSSVLLNLSFTFTCAYTQVCSRTQMESDTPPLAGKHKLNKHFVNFIYTHSNKHENSLNTSLSPLYANPQLHCGEIPCP